MIYLSPRLKKIVSLLELPAKIIDVGTDHAYIPIYLAQTTNSSHLIATDCRRKPYQTAIKHVKKYGVDNRVEVRLGRGFSVIKEGEVDVAIIAGMGCESIKEIISRNYDLACSFKYLILQPMTGAAQLRKWLVINNFKITNEALAKEEERLYQIITVKSGQMEVDDEFLLEIGPQLIKREDVLLDDYLKGLEEKWLGIIKGIKRSNSGQDKIRLLQSRLNRLREIKDTLN